MPYPQVKLPQQRIGNENCMKDPLPQTESQKVSLIKGPNIVSLPNFESMPISFKLPVLIKLSDNISTDAISPAGLKVLPFRSNIPKISEFVYKLDDPTYVSRAIKQRELGGHCLIGGENYGQGSSREHAALAPRYLGLRVIIVKSFARIHWRNLINFGILPLIFDNPNDYDEMEQGDIIEIQECNQIPDVNQLEALITNKNKTIKLNLDISKRQKEFLMAGGLINWAKISNKTDS